MFKLFNPILNKRAQIALPSVMLIPIMLLVIYLLLETAKLSREKVRQQFAVDTAAFAEMTNTSNFLNLASYTNVFPYKLFREVWPPEPKDIELDRDSNIVVSGGQNFPSAVSRYDIITAAGAFPFMPPGNPEPKPTDIEWQILYPEGTDRAGWMTETPNINTSTVYDFWNKDMVAAYKYNRVVPGAPDVNIDMPAFGSYLAYYILLSKMYKDQRSYYDRISNDEGEFYRRGYIQNICGAKECVCRLNECGREGARYFKGSTVKTVPVFIKKIKLVYVTPNKELNEFPVDLAEQLKKDSPEGLFQFVHLDRSAFGTLRKLYLGVDIKQPFKAPDNYFNVNLNTSKYNPYTHVRVGMQCTKESNNCVWPFPTPKYQVRMWP